MPQEQVSKKRPEDSQEQEKPKPNISNKSKEGEKRDDLDKILDGIDDVLEENAEEFVKAYVQRGGE